MRNKILVFILDIILYLILLLFMPMLYGGKIIDSSEINRTVQFIYQQF